MASAGRLVGPPAARKTAISATKDAAVASQIHFCKPPTHDDAHEWYPRTLLPLMGLTENFSPTFLSSGNPCLNFFFHVVPDIPPKDLIERLELAWAHDALTTLKLIFNLRGVRGTGKSDKEGFYVSALWLHRAHPKTLAFNVKALADFGYLKDLPEILYRLLEGKEVRKLAKADWEGRKQYGKRISWGRKTFFKKTNSRKFHRGGGIGKRRVLYWDEEKKEKLKHLDKEVARASRKEWEISQAVKALDRYNGDSDYRLLFDSVCDVFAELLRSDLAFLGGGEVRNISLAAKWCPTIDSSYDKSLLLCEGIARRVFPRECEKEYEEIEDAHYAYRVRDRLRKQVLVPLHKALELPEVYMSANRWNSLPYNRVASVAMKTYKGLFEKHDERRFWKYLEKVKSGKAKIASGALLPHEIIRFLNDGDGDEVAELQWERMVGDLAKKGKLTNCIAVCDVSGSMEGNPMEVCVALGLLVSELSEEPWKGKVITFSENPELHLIEGDSLQAKTEFISTMDWGANTDFQAVFDQILGVAVEDNLTEDQLINRVFVFSDMEFDEAYGLDSWETDYQVIQRKFRENGYNRVPEIVFWNLRNSSSTPVVASQNGVALVSGFSKNMLTVFMEKGGIVSPEGVMGLAIAGEEYRKLVVHDWYVCQRDQNSLYVHSLII